MTQQKPNHFTHLDSHGRAHMVDIHDKPSTHRMARAEGYIVMLEETWQKIVNQQHKKGDVLQIARIAGIMAAKKTADVIPLCHPIPITHISIEFSTGLEEAVEPKSNHIEAGQRQIRCVSRCETLDRTGIEMEALTATSVALLTIYDMCKAMDRGMCISYIRLLEKSGGKSGDFHAPPLSPPFE